MRIPLGMCHITLLQSSCRIGFPHWGPVKFSRICGHARPHTPNRHPVIAFTGLTQGQLWVRMSRCHCWTRIYPYPCPPGRPFRVCLQEGDHNDAAAQPRSMIQNAPRWDTLPLACLTGRVRSPDWDLAEMTCPQKSVNDRRRKVISRILDDSRSHLTTSKYARLTTCSNETALRDIRRCPLAADLPNETGLPRFRRSNHLAWLRW
jgi:hypothetical protein